MNTECVNKAIQCFSFIVLAEKYINHGEELNTGMKDAEDNNFSLLAVFNPNLKSECAITEMNIS